jgi:hypothetical protein
MYLRFGVIDGSGCEVVDGGGVGAGRVGDGALGTRATGGGGTPLSWNRERSRGVK